eukprot:NODE_1712_length_1631_cov_115.667772_g1632_i0.p1 GENE.NODE_1712_length_1631_cov_115.667772_g1632_i0~~NODE_1712_length_1631_cov_115.667772_g1632_i0.p1  ORF type:complete len:463 (+),score=63.63 NODE_1712_length_1631_cov_115.667772_g1632_i0:58-1389(+)
MATRQLQISLPSDRADEIITELRSNIFVHSIERWRTDPIRSGVRVKGRESLQCESVASSIISREDYDPDCPLYHMNDLRLTCVVATKHSPLVLNDLRRLGLGKDFGVIQIVPLQAITPRLPPISSAKRKYRMSDRMTIDEIYSVVDCQTHLTFDYLVSIVLAGTVCAVGLLTNSDSTVVASMIMSPLMGPILAVSLGSLVNDKEMVRKGLRNEAVGVLVCFATGVTIGLCVMVLPYDMRKTLVTDAPNEMNSRGIPMNLIPSFFIAAPSGAALTLSITSESSATLVGVAIAVAVLPPIINTGLYLSISIMTYLIPNELSHIENLRSAAISFCLFLLNWFCIFLFSNLMLRIKKVTAPSGQTPVDIEGEFLVPVDDELENPSDSKPLISSESRQPEYREKKGSVSIKDPTEKTSLVTSPPSGKKKDRGRARTQSYHIDDQVINH